MRKVYLMVIVLVIILSGCTKEKIDSSTVESNCAPLIVPVSESKEIVLNGMLGHVSGDYWQLIDAWINVDNPKDMIYIFNERDFVWIRIDENDYGYLYGGTYTIDGEKFLLIVYANGEVVEEHNFEYLIDEQGYLRLIDEQGVEIKYFPAPLGEMGDLGGL